MAISTLINRVKTTVAVAPGTGAITLGSAIPGFLSFVGAGAIDGQLVSYIAEDANGAFEFGQGAYSASGPSLARTTILGSSSGGAAISLSSAATISATALATDLQGWQLPLAGGTLTGPLILAADPTTALGAATRQYIDNKIDNTPPQMDGAASYGASWGFARADHRHPTDTSRYAVSNPAGYQTAAQVFAFLGTFTGPLTCGTMNATTVTATGTVSGANVSASNGISATTFYSSGGISAVTSISAANFYGINISCTGSGVFGLNVYPYTYWPDFFIGAVNAGYHGIQWEAGYYDTYNAGTRYYATPSGNVLTLDQYGNLTIVGGASKQGGGVWGATSDARIKTVIGDYLSGLTEVLSLQPVVYTYKGNDTPTANLDIDARMVLQYDGTYAKGPKRTFEAAPYSGSPHCLAATAKTPFVGFVAQDVEAAFPGMVSQRAGYIDGVKVTDLRELDTSELVFALVNAIKTLTDRIVALESKSV